MEKSFQKRLEKDTKSAQVDLNKFMRREFACEADARKEAEIWLDQHPFHKLVDLDIVTKCKRAGQKRGRPKKGEDMVTVYQVLARLEINEEILEKARHKLGRFIPTIRKLIQIRYWDIIKGSNRSNEDSGS